MDWISSLICIFVSLHFYQRRKGKWWMLVALAFFLPLLGSFLFDLRNGLLPLPYGIDYPAQYSARFTPGMATAMIKTTVVSISWDTVSPIMALALGWAYLADKKRPAASVQT
jgi:hypothetical protein